MPETPPFLVTRPGESLDSLSATLHRASGIDISTAQRLLRDNNDLDAMRRLHAGQALCVATAPLAGAERERWLSERQHVMRVLSTNHPLRGLTQETPSLIMPLGQFAETARQSGWLTGDRFAELGGYGATGVSAYAETIGRELLAISRLADDVYRDVLHRFSGSSPFGVSKTQLGQLEAMLRSHPKYQALRMALDKLPAYITRKLGPIDLAGHTRAHADFFRRQFMVPRGVASGAFLGRVSNQLGAQVLRYGKLAGRATWFVPAILGAISVANAPRGQRLRIASGETLGIALGAVGTTAGTLLATALVGLIVAPGIIVIAAGILGGAALGYAGYKFGKFGGTLLYDFFSDVMDDLAGSFIEVF